MATIPNKDPVPSESPQNVKFNAGKMDEAINSQSPEYEDRLGKNRKTWAGIELDIKNVLSVLEKSGGLLAFGSLAELMAFRPATPNVLAQDTSTGIYYFWNGSDWAKSGYQFTDEFSELSAWIQRIYLAINVLSASTIALQDEANGVSQGIITQLNASLARFDAEITDRKNIDASYLLALSGISSAINAMDVDSTGKNEWMQRFFLSLSTLTASVSATVDESLGVSGSLVNEVNERKSTDTGMLVALNSVFAILSQLDDVTSKIPTADTTAKERYDGQYVFGAPDGIIRIDLTTDSIPASKSEPPVRSVARLNISGEIMTVYSLISVQGASSASYPKKNLNIEMYSDSTYSDTVELKIGEIIPHDEWVFKSNWIDNMHTRNLLSYRLWGEVMASRKGWPKRDIDQSYVGKSGAASVDTGATGHPVGYPAILFVNDTFYGIGDLMVGKKRKNYNIAKNKPTQILIDNGDWINLDGLSVRTVDTEIKAPSKITDETNQAIADWDSFAGSSQANFTLNAATYLDKNNIIDFFLFSMFLHTTDLIQLSADSGHTQVKNVQIVTWDGKKWFLMPYDLDTVFGLSWGGGYINPPTADQISVTPFFVKLYQTYGADIRARYASLRNSGIFSVDAVYRLSRQLSSRYTAEMFEAEYEKWPTIPAPDNKSIGQLMDWVKTRLVFLDNKFNYSA